MPHGRPQLSMSVLDLMDTPNVRPNGMNGCFSCPRPACVCKINAVRTQVWTALIAMLVLKYLQLKSKFSWSLSTLAALLRQQLFFYRDLWVWLDDPFQAPPALVGVHDDAQQLEITW